MADREFSTLGYERRHNPMLQIDGRDAFIAKKLAEHHYQPPYFRLMEALNREGAAAPRHPLSPPPLDAGEVERLAKAVLVDVRGTAAYLGAHPPRSLNLPEGMVSAFAGWLLEPDQPLVLIAGDAAQAATAARHLARIGYDRVIGYLDTTMPGWAALGGRLASVPSVGVGEVARRVDERPQGWTLLDVRGADEIAQGVIEGAQTVYLGELPRRLDGLDRGRHYTTMCASGARAAIAASVLRRHGFRAVDVFLGSMGAWQRADCPVAAPAG